MCLAFLHLVNGNLSDSEILEFAPPLSKTAVDFLNSLVSIISPDHVSVEDLSQVDLPELYALQVSYLIFTSCNCF